MTNKELARKLCNEFDEKYGRMWESEAHHSAAMDHFLRERKVDKFLDATRLMFLESSDKDDFTFKLNIAYDQYIIQYKRNLADPYLSDDDKKDAEIMIGIMSDLKTFVNELYISYRISYPPGTEAAPEPLPKEFQFDDDLISSVIGDEWLSVQNVADILGLKTETVYKKARSREIPVHKPGKRLQFKRRDIDAYIQKTRRKSISEIDADAEKKMRRL